MSFFFRTDRIGTGRLSFAPLWISRAGFPIIFFETIPPRPDRPEWISGEIVHKSERKSSISTEFPPEWSHMYRTSSPIFDVPEFPPLRRVKPLPKRKRIHPPSESDRDFGRSDGHPTTVTVPPQTAAATQPRLSSTTPSVQTSLSGRKDNGTSPSEKAGTQAHRSPVQLDYYKPTSLGDHQTERQERDPYDDDSPRKKIATHDPAGIPSIYDIPLAAFGIYVPRINGPAADGSEAIDEDHGEGDYVDHLQQHGNTKKRKVPANMSGGGRHGHHGDPGSGENSGADDDEGQGRLDGSGALGGTSRGIPTGRPFEHDHPPQFDDQGPPSPTSTFGSALSLLPGRKLKMSPATRAGLQHKEVLKSRKKQLAAVLGALSHGDTLALDQALSARYPYGLPGELKGALVPPKTRLSRRKGPRILRELRTRKLDGAENTNSGFPSASFLFIHKSASECLVQYVYGK